MYGPFSAAYPGNSMGAVVEITTRMPQKFEAGVKAQAAWQDYSLYGTSNTYRSNQVSGILGSRNGDLSWWLSVNHLDSQTQPINIITALRPAAPSAAGTPVTGAFMDTNRLGQPIAVIGSGGLEHKEQDTFKAKLAYDFTPEWRAAYTIGTFQNDAKSKVDTYLRNAAGAPVYSGASLNIGGYNFTNIGTTSFSSSSGFYPPLGRAEDVERRSCFSSTCSKRFPRSCIAMSLNASVGPFESARMWRLGSSVRSGVISGVPKISAV